MATRRTAQGFREDDLIVLVCRRLLQGYLAHKKIDPPRTTIGPSALAYCRILGGSSL